jgi:alcohol dehydrogenase
MRAAQLTAYGSQDALVVQEVEKPRPGTGQVLVAVQAAGLNPFDWKVREGMMKEFIPLELPATLGGDLAGTVSELGPGVTEWNVGDVVFGQAGAVSGNGSWAEFAPAKVSSLTRKPENISTDEAAGASLIGISSHQALVETLQLQSGQKILIHGGAGGIGSFAIQYAKHLGAYVATTVSADDIDFVKQLGADEAIDYRTQDFSQLLTGYDAVYDMVGGETTAKSYGILKQGGRLVSMVAEPDEALMEEFQVNASHQSSQPNPERLQAVAELLEQGAVRVRIDKVFPLDQAAAALEHLKTGSPRGKVVLQVA